MTAAAASAAPAGAGAAFGASDTPDTALLFQMDIAGSSADNQGNNCDNDEVFHGTAPF